jgi:hypothetical protein
MVVTCRVPCLDLEQLELTVLDHTIDVAAPGGFRHELELPPEADVRRLAVELHKGFLEVRAPRGQRTTGGVR